MNLADAITTVSAKPTKAVTNWMTDKVAPSYWTPNYLIIVRVSFFVYIL